MSQRRIGRQLVLASLTVHSSRPGRREKLHEHRIADPLHLSHKMVRNYMSNIFTKLGVAHRTVPRRTVRGPGMPA